MTAAEPWYAVRCLFAFSGEGATAYEERITLWRASSFEDAVAMAEEDAAEYSETVEAPYIGLAQAFHLAVKDRSLESGNEVFSLMRESVLEPDAYISQFFDTGREHQRPLD